LGDDVLSGGSGSDTYRFSMGSGRDEIRDSESGQSQDSGIDTIEFDSTIVVGDIKLTAYGDDALVDVRATGQRIIIRNQLASGTAQDGIEQIRFADGTTWTQEDINAAVIKTLETTVLPSPGTRAYDTIIPSVVRIVGLGKDKDGKEDGERSVGTGVVIVDKGIILTNLHVVQGATTIKVTFSDGLESTASISGVQPENDLAVLQAHKIPDDLIAATMRSTADLAPGDQVMAVGYPFGIGPSASAGVISGLKRNFRSPEGKQMMSNLIQFDAAANPGNSGGPLVTMDGEVIGIVTAIFNPNQQRTFVGIGFAVPIENAASAAGMPPF
jgi:S1-C subfamily serine protease